MQLPVMSMMKSPGASHVLPRRIWRLDMRKYYLIMQKQHVMQVRWELPLINYKKSVLVLVIKLKIIMDWKLVWMVTRLNVWRPSCMNVKSNWHTKENVSMICVAGCCLMAA